MYYNLGCILSLIGHYRYVLFYFSQLLHTSGSYRYSCTLMFRALCAQQRMPRVQTSWFPDIHPLGHTKCSHSEVHRPSLSSHCSCQTLEFDRLPGMPGTPVISTSN